jgi:hypothetical protein
LNNLIKPLVILILLLSFAPTSRAQDSLLRNSCRGCELLNNLDHSLKVIDDSAFGLIRHGFTGDCDSCFFGMVDSLKYRFIRTSNTKYIIALSNLASNSDGAYTEDFENADMFFKNFKPYCDYFYNTKDTGMLFFCMIRELMFEMYISNYQPDTAKINDIRHFIKKQEARYRITGGEKKFIDSFIDRAKQEAKLEDDSTQEEN